MQVAALLHKGVFITIATIAVNRNGPRLLFAVAWQSVVNDLSTVAVRTLLALFFV